MVTATRSRSDRPGTLDTTLTPSPPGVAGDQHGRWFIDAFAGLYCVNIGYGRTEVVDAIHEQARKLAFFHINTAHSNEPAARLADRLVRMGPGNISKVFFGVSGSDANDTSVKLVWYYNNAIGRPKKKKIVGRDRGYHGGTVMGSSLSGLSVIHKGFDLPIGPVRHTVAAHYYWGAEAGMSERQFSRHCADALDELIVWSIVPVSSMPGLSGDA